MTIEEYARLYVEIVKHDGDEVVQRLGPLGKHRAGKVQDGVNINLNHDKYYTRIVDMDGNEEP